MDIVVKARGCEIPARLKDDARARVERATRIFDRLLTAEVVFSLENNPRIAEPAIVEVTGRTKGHHVRALGSGQDHRGAVDVAMARFERQLRRYKTRMVDRRRSGAPAGNGWAAQQPTATLTRSGGVAGHDDEAHEPWPQIVRRKTFELHPMLPEEAALQLELLGHEFYLFTNAGTGACNVVYRRRDGDLGLIEAATPT